MPGLLAVWGGGGSLLFAGEAAPENSPSGPRLIALRIVGSNVKNPAGEYLGRIEEAAVNADTGQIEFALLHVGYPADTARLTPVPWNALVHVWDQGQAGGIPGAIQTFNLNMSRNQLDKAPTLARNAWPSSLGAQGIAAYYGTEAQGGTGPGREVSTGTGQGSGQSVPPGQLPYTVPVVVAGDGGVLITNLPPTNAIALTNQIVNTNLFVSQTNFLPSPTNVFLPSPTNLFPGARVPFNPNNQSGFAPGTPNPGPASGPAIPAAGEGNPSATTPPAANPAPVPITPVPAPERPVRQVVPPRPVPVVPTPQR